MKKNEVKSEIQYEQEVIHTTNRIHLKNYNAKLTIDVIINKSTEYCEKFVSLLEN